MPMIEFKNVSKWYGTHQVLKDCTTDIARGEVVVVCGPSGSGKSTLIKCVNGLEPFQSGEIIVNSQSVGAKETNLPRLRSMIGMVFQSFERRRGRFVSLLPTDSPLTISSPCWKGSSPLTHLMSVLLPDPDGPHTTTTSPWSTFVVQSFSTWKAPYHLLTFLNSIIGMFLSPVNRE